MKKENKKPFRLLRGDWHFEGYQGVAVDRKHGGRQRRELVYVGDYYRFELSSRQRKRLLWCCALSCAVAAAAYLALNFFPFTATALAYVGVPLLLALLPLIYLLIGVVCLCTTPEKMTVRNLYSSVRRMKRSVSVMLAFVSLTLMGDIVFLIVFQGYYFPSEFLFPLFCVISLSALSVIWYQLYRHPVAAVKEKAESPDGKK